MGKTSVPNAVRYIWTILDLSFRTMMDNSIIRSAALNTDVFGTEV